MNSLAKLTPKLRRARLRSGVSLAKLLDPYERHIGNLSPIGD